MSLGKFLFENIPLKWLGLLASENWFGCNKYNMYMVIYHFMWKKQTQTRFRIFQAVYHSVQNNTTTNYNLLNLICLCQNVTWHTWTYLLSYLSVLSWSRKECFSAETPSWKNVQGADMWLKWQAPNLLWGEHFC